MDYSIVDVLWLSESFWGARIGNFDIKPKDGATIFAYLRTGNIWNGLLNWIKKIGEKLNGIDGIWTLGLPGESSD